MNYENLQFCETFYIKKQNLELKNSCYLHRVTT